MDLECKKCDFEVNGKGYFLYVIFFKVVNGVFDYVFIMIEVVIRLLDKIIMWMLNIVIFNICGKIGIWKINVK